MCGLWADNVTLVFGSTLSDAVPVDNFDLDGDGDVTEPIPLDLAGGLRFTNDPDTPDIGVSDPKARVRRPSRGVLGTACLPSASPATNADALPGPLRSPGDSAPIVCTPTLCDTRSMPKPGRRVWLEAKLQWNKHLRRSGFPA